MKRRWILVIFLLLILGIGWFLFRPERLFVNARVNETLPNSPGTSAGTPAALLTGRFHDGAHKGAGTATIHQLAEGERVLRLTNFETSNGPDVHVYLVAANDATDNETVT